MADDPAREAPDLGRGEGRGRRRGRVAPAVAVWLVVVMATSALAWFAIGRAGSEVLDPAVQAVPTTTPGSPPSGTPPTTTVAPTTAAPTSGQSASSSAAPVATPVDEVTTVPGGQVGFRCTGSMLSLHFAQPATGWSVRQESSAGGARIRVELESGEQRYEVEAVCAGGAPNVTVQSDDDDGDGGDDDSDG